MKKKLFWTILILIIIAIGALAWHFFSPYKKADMLNAIPQKPVFIIETDDSYDAWEKLTKSEVWGHLRKHQLFAKVATGMDMIDTIVQSNEKLAKYLGKRNILISMHMIGNNAYDFVYIVDLRRASKLATFNKVLKGFLSSNYEVKDYSHHGETIYKLTDTKSLTTVYLCFLNNLLVASFNPKLLESSVDQYDNPELAKDNNFLTIHDKLKGEGLFRIFLNYAQLDD